MEPFGISLLTTALVYGIKRWNEARKKKAGLPDPPVFSQAQIHGFTTLKPEGREFDRDFAEAVMRVLPQRSAMQLEPKALGLPPTFAARVYRLVLPRAGFQTGDAVVRQAQAQGETVLGSLSLRMLTAGTPDAMLLVVGPAEVRGLAAPVQSAPDGTVHQGFFALFPAAQPAEAAAPSPPEPAAETAAAAAEPPVASPPEHVNGKAPAAQIDMSKWDKVEPPRAEG